MNGATIQARINTGLATASRFIGLPHNQYRPLGISNPISIGNLLGSMLCSFNIRGSYSGQVMQNQLFWQGILPRGLLQLGDYLVGQYTYCIVGLDALLPPIALRCTQSLSFSRVAIQQGAGLQAYQDLKATTVYAANVLGVLTQKKESGAPRTGLPGDAALRAFFEANFYLPDGTVQMRDFVTDENGQKYQVVSCSFGLLGYQALLEIVEA